MIFKYDCLSGVCSSGKTIQINEDSSIKKIDGLVGVDYVTKRDHHHDYYVFVQVDDENGVVINTDNHTDMGYFMFHTPLSEFYFEVNTKASLLDFYDGPGEEIDFPDIMEKEDIPSLYEKYHDATDDELIKTNAYRDLDTYVSKYLRLGEQTEKKINLTIIRLAFVAYRDSQLVKA